MRVFFREMLTAGLLTAVLAALVCGAYPVAVLVLAQGAFPAKANGSLVWHDGVVVGSELLGQPFSAPGYFHPRPSAAGGGYDTAASGGGNLGPTSGRLVERTRELAQQYREENGLHAGFRVPADAVTASGSGLDPHISVPNALLQAARVAGARGLDVKTVKDSVRAAAAGRTLRVLGEPRVNVLRLNLMMDALSGQGTSAHVND